ncbi:hypothetical protein AG1IA_10133 [Rhizoctonia solani AG-1 IA]|uniref:Uncharacterized protein n=1 Tax=Thanatephorus cucumeris (strain AG1-IA) TaxID=983506 RepID=L8WGK2_THACA|nr:hypothetical protein AG1IA_10133 [Rhizoctonia solani AG-1 IA]
MRVRSSVSRRVADDRDLPPAVRRHLQRFYYFPDGAQGQECFWTIAWDEQFHCKRPPEVSGSTQATGGSRHTWRLDVMGDVSPSWSVL